MTELSKLFNDYDYWLCCIIYINHHIRNALLDILHDEEHGLPRDPGRLYVRLKKELEKPKKKDEFREYFESVKNKSEGAILMPSDKASDSQNWDNTVIMRMITIFRTDIPAPNNRKKWTSKKSDLKGEDYQKPGDKNYPPPAYLIEARDERNLFFHSVICKMTLPKFKLVKENIRSILVGLGYKNLEEFDNDDCLNTIDLPNIRKLLNTEFNYVYRCKRCGFTSKFKEVVDTIRNNLERQNRKYDWKKILK